jgi:hypothetical protein
VSDDPDGEETDAHRDAEGDPDDGEPDPFSRLGDEYADREGDPFEQLGGPGPSDDEPVEQPADVDGAGGDSPRTDDPGTSPETGTSEQADVDGPGNGDDADPFSYVEDDDVAMDDQTGPETGDDDTPTPDDTGRQVDPTGVDGVEDPLGGIDQRESERDMPGRGDAFAEETGPFESVDLDGVDHDEVWDDLTDTSDSESVTERTEELRSEVSKHDFCETCEYFSPPPDVHCTHEGTQILEFLDMDRVRLANCPIVEKRKQLEDPHR